MSSRIVVAWSTLGLVSIFGATEPARGQGGDWQRVDAPIMAERLYLADFRTLYECLERVAFDHSLTIRSSGLFRSWRAIRIRDGLDEDFVVMADERKYPWLKDRALGYLNSAQPGANPDATERTKLILDLDTGELRTPEGVDVDGWQIKCFQLQVALMRRGTNESYQLNLVREFSDKQIKIFITSQQRDAQADCREFLDSLESKLKLASRLKQAKVKKERRPQAQPEKPK